MKFMPLSLAVAVLSPALALAQQDQAPPLYPAPGNPAEQQSQQNLANQQNSQTPVFRVNVYARTARAVNYRNRGGSTSVDFKGTELMPSITGHAKIDGKAGRLAIDADLDHLGPTSAIGPQYLTYVLWAVTPEGRAVNLGEVLPNGNGRDKLSVTTDLQAFGLIVTAEPYFAVTHPSDKVVAENVIPTGVKGFEEPIDAKFDVLEGREYTIDAPPDQLPSAQAQPNVPLDLLEARNAVAIAKAAGAQQYANDSVQKAEDMLQRAEDYYQRKQGRTPIGTAARGATQMAEDARVLTLRKKESEREEAARRAAADAQAKAEADAESAKRDAEQAQAQANEDARKRAEAEQARAEAERQQATMLAQQQASEAQLAAAHNAADDAQRRLQDAQNQMAQAEQERQQAEMQSQQAQQQTQQAQQQAQQAIQEKEQMRARLREQLNQVLQTRDTARGLIVSMPDVLFDFNKYTLKSEARERLAKISGIVEAYPGLKLQVEGHTDSIGSDEYNVQLSEKRADSVRAYLVSNGVRPDSVSAQGFGKADPVADNSTASGRKLNRRVDMVVSGDVIGTELSTPSIEALPQSANR
ncbi:MAG: OmpA family protein [Candidatus Sulfotelmatobacter sp.]|jgi:outer membrane protein OmpA-like peptidoglycan-associated protein